MPKLKQLLLPPTQYYHHLFRKLVSCLCNLSEHGGQPYGTCNICWWGLLKVIGQEPGLEAKYHLAGLRTLLRPVLGQARWSARKSNTQKQVLQKQKTVASRSCLEFLKENKDLPTTRFPSFCSTLPQVNDSLYPLAVGSDCKLCLKYISVMNKNSRQTLQSQVTRCVTILPVHPSPSFTSSIVKCSFYSTLTRLFFSYILGEEVTF